MIADRDGRWREAFEPSKESRRGFCFGAIQVLADISVAPVLAPPWIAGKLAAGLASLDAGLRALGNQRSLELGDGAVHLQ